MLSEKDKEKVYFIVSKAILMRYDKALESYYEYKFCPEDIVKEVEKDVLKYFDSKEELKKYVIEKLNAMCDDCVLARTETHYFFYW